MSAADSTLASTRLADQRHHQVRLARKRMTWWIPLIFVAGLGVSAYGLVPATAVFREGRSASPLVLFGVFAVLFGWAVVLWLLGPFLMRPRIVPCFARESRAVRGRTMAALRRGRALDRESTALDRLAESLGVMLRLSAKDSMQVVRTREVRQGSFW